MSVSRERSGSGCPKCGHCRALVVCVWWNGDEGWSCRPHLGCQEEHPVNVGRLEEQRLL